MLLTGGKLRVALATTHLPLAKVSGALSIESLCHTLATLAQALERWWGIRAPRIAVCGLNPHAGEGGHLGDEELTIIQPALERARARALDVHGPLPADTMFVPRILRLVPCSPYHDQGLPVIKRGPSVRST
jgi:4-hydroxythreonine-4-phosphate dehydrogenase